MTQAEQIIAKCGGVNALARALGHKHPTTVSSWHRRGWIPARQQPVVLEAAKALGVLLTPADFFDAGIRTSANGEAA